MGSYIERCQRLLDITNKELAAMANISVSYLLDVKKGKHNLTYDKLMNIVEGSGIPIDYFIGEDLRINMIMTIVLFAEYISKNQNSEINETVSYILKRASENEK